MLTTRDQRSKFKDHPPAPNILIALVVVLSSSARSSPSIPPRPISVDSSTEPSFAKPEPAFTEPDPEFVVEPELGAVDKMPVDMPVGESVMRVGSEASSVRSAMRNADELVMFQNWQISE